ncbi:MAG: hypothetical protein FWG65_04310 [Turicibacter sp.]|nr:hypothetical protein [Turicibacter sp.]
MVSTCKVDVHKKYLLYGETEIKCGGKSTARPSLFDTGAGISHMSYGLWLEMGLDEVLFNDNPPLMHLLKINSKDDFTFDNLPMTAQESTLGDKTKIKVYEFCLDSLTLGVRSLGSSPIHLENITVRLMSPLEADFFVGWNVLKYLKISYDPTPQSAVCTFELTHGGEMLLADDRKKRLANHMERRFNYLEV